jgi:hypothetical protein
MAQQDRPQEFAETFLVLEEVLGRPVVLPRATIRHDVGDGVGYNHGFTYFEGFLPLWQSLDDTLVYLDLRTVNFDDARFWEFNAGGGMRWFNPLTDRILGVNSFYDGRLTGDDYFNQIGFGLESLGWILDLRANFYFPVGERRHKVFDSGPVNPQFVGNNIAVDRGQAFDVAMRGFDVEAGGPLPFLTDFDPRAYVGYYHYEGNGARSANGIRGRLEAHLSRNLSLHFAVQNDQVFDTTVNGGLALHWGGSRGGQGPRTFTEALGQRVVRDVNIVLAKDTQTTKELAIDPVTGQPLIIKHASSSASADGDGTVERPFQTLKELQEGSAPGHILFAHAGSVFDKQRIVLQNGQRLLGEGIQHTYTSALGAFVLPRATSATGLPIISNSANRAIVLASNTEVAGLVIKNPDRNGIFGRDIGNINLNRNTITNTTRSAIRLVDISGEVRITDNTISETDRHGIKIVNNNATRAQATIANNTFTDIAVCGCGDPIHVLLRDSTTWSGTITGNKIDQTGGEGIFISARNNASAAAIITGNSILGAGLGIDLESSQSAIGSFQVARNNLDQISILGLWADSSKNATMSLQLFGNTSSADFLLNTPKNGDFRVEDTLTTNNMTGGASITTLGGVVTVPFGTLGFPAPPP